MATLTTLLRTEIARLSRRETKASIGPLRQSLSASRAENAALRRRVIALEKQVRALARSLARSARSSAAGPAATDADAGGTPLRFRPQGMASHRARLGLSASEFGRLIGASAQSVYAWEQAKSRPRDRHLAAIAELRSIGKREARRRLAAQASGS